MKKEHIIGNWVAKIDDFLTQEHNDEMKKTCPDYKNKYPTWVIMECIENNGYSFVADCGCHENTEKNAKEIIEIHNNTRRCSKNLEDNKLYLKVGDKVRTIKGGRFIKEDPDIPHGKFSGTIVRFTKWGIFNAAMVKKDNPKEGKKKVVLCLMKNLCPVEVI